MTSIDTRAAESSRAAANAKRRWSVADSNRTYGLDGWGGGYFGVGSDGHLLVMPTRDPERTIDLYELTSGLSAREIYTPVIVRFTDMLRSRILEVHDAFDKAINDNNYKGQYTLVYPIKVNQQRQLCEQIRDFGHEHGFGMEAGSKPELLAVLGLTSSTPGMPIVCNGFKDREYIETVILATKLGRNIIPVVERFRELQLIIETAKRYGMKPNIGLRMKPTSRGSGRWQSSGGVRSKFGLSAGQALRALDLLRSEGLEGSLKMLHFHIGSQICDIRHFKTAVSELARLYTELSRLGAGLDTIDVGGGLGLDYDGSRSTFDSSVNYTLNDYAQDVVYRIKTACDESGLAHPRIISESGRAVTAMSSVMVVDVLGRAEFPVDPDIKQIREDLRNEPEPPQPLLDIMDAFERLQAGGDYLDIFHDLQQTRDEAMSLFQLGYLTLPMRASFERLYWSASRKVLETAIARGGPMHDELAELPTILSDIYFCNFSLFQSLPDSWAIDQLFPICPIHRLDEEPVRRGILADITCDSDGQIDRFSSPDSRAFKETLELHELIPATTPGLDYEPYYLGVFLLGAYQEVLGDLHNLFGDTHVVYVSLAEGGGYSIDEVIEGDTVEEVLSYTQYDPKLLERNMRLEVERAVRTSTLTVSEGSSLLKFYMQGMEGYTYLE